MSQVEGSVDVVNKSGRICQQSVCGRLPDVSHAANDRNALSRNGKLEQKGAKDSLSHLKTSAKERKLLRKSKRFEKRGFVGNQIGEESEDDTLRRFV